MKTKYVERGLLIAGLLCLIPSACVGVRRTATADNIFLALRPEDRIPLDSLRDCGQATVLFEAPDEPAVRGWGRRSYVVMGRFNRNGYWAHPFGALGLVVRVIRNNAPVELQSVSRVPYGYSSETTDVGLGFAANPSDSIRVEIVAQHPEALPDGELVITPDWSNLGKDRIVESMIEENMRKIARWSAWAGFGLLALSLGIAIVRWLFPSANSTVEPPRA